ncbi:MAG: lysylphosphatidylglycerol synthase transmembrane domain-containing protein [Candidatus Krumholzibacteriia bacterium]
MKRKLLLGSLVSALFLYLAMRDIQWSTLWDVVKRTQFRYLIPSAFFTMFGHYCRSYRWKFMMLPVKRIPTNNLFAATAVGFMANNLLPARLGELVRAYILGKRERVSRTASFATIVYERVVDVFTLLVLLWVMLLKVDGPEWLRTSGAWILVVNVALLGMMVFMERKRETFLRWVTRLASPLPDRMQARADRATQAFVSGLTTVTQARTLLPIALTSALVWLCAILGFYFCLLALDMHPPFVASVTLVVLVSMGTMIPSAPAYLGTTQYACIVSLAIFGIGKSEALAYSLLYHATHFFPITLTGLFYLWRMHIRFDELREGGDQ